MAGGAGDGAGRGQLRVLEQPLAQRDLGGRRQIVGGVGTNVGRANLAFRAASGRRCWACGAGQLAMRVGHRSQVPRRCRLPPLPSCGGGAPRVAQLPWRAGEGVSTHAARRATTVLDRQLRSCRGIRQAADDALPSRGRGVRALARPVGHQYLEACSSMSEISADILPGSRIGFSGGIGAGQAVFSSARSLADLVERRGVLLGKLGGGAVQHALGLPHEAAAVLILDRLGEAAVLDRRSRTRSSATFSTSAADFAVKPSSGVMKLTRHGQRALEPLVDDLQRLLVGALALGLHGLRQRLQLAAGRGGCCAA